MENTSSACSLRVPQPFSACSLPLTPSPGSCPSPVSPGTAQHLSTTIALTSLPSHCHLNIPYSVKCEIVTPRLKQQSYYKL